tara:strand:+ start:790 stop:906 length:117 start_codon:yes stop_codon:yes gene_type:complete
MELADWINVLWQGANAEHFKPSDAALQGAMTESGVWAV